MTTTETSIETLSGPDLRAMSAGLDRPLVDLILERLETLIMEGHLKAGDRLKELSLAAEWNVSRGPIREACRVLQEAGLVDIQPNRGACVRKVSLSDVLHGFDIRGALWRLAAREAARNMSHRQMDELEALIGDMARVIAREDVAAYIALNTRFHDAIVVASGNRPLVALQRRLFLQARLFRRQSLVSGTAGLDERNEDHKKMLAAFRRGDHEEAGRLSEQHVANSKARFVASIETGTAPSLAVFDR